MSKLKRPHYFTANEDKAIINLFPFVSTEKLSILMNISTQKIVARFQHLNQRKKAYERR